MLVLGSTQILYVELNWFKLDLTAYTLFFFNKNIAFQAQAGIFLFFLAILDWRYSLYEHS